MAAAAARVLIELDDVRRGGRAGALDRLCTRLNSIGGYPKSAEVLLLALLAGAEVDSTAPDRGAPTLRSLKHALPAPRRAAAQPDCISGGPFLIESDRRFANERRAGDVHAVRFHVRRHVPGVVPTHLCLLACWPTRGHLYHTILAVAWKMG